MKIRKPDLSFTYERVKTTKKRVVKNCLNRNQQIKRLGVKKENSRFQLFSQLNTCLTIFTFISIFLSFLIFQAFNKLHIILFNSPLYSGPDEHNLITYLRTRTFINFNLIRLNIYHRDDLQSSGF